MSSHLEERLQSHNYFNHPLRSNYLNNNSSRINNGLIVYKKSHSNELTIIEDTQTDIDCLICLRPAVNPFRCSKADETPEQYNEELRVNPHIVCYQCLAEYMKSTNSDTKLCPLNCGNAFHLNNLIPANDSVYNESLNYMMYCENGCGLMGDPIALSHHICALSDVNSVGHSIDSNIVQSLNKRIVVLEDEMKQLNEELVNRKYWKSKYMALKSINKSHIEQLAKLTVNLEEKNSICEHLKRSVKEKNVQNCKFKAEKDIASDYFKRKIAKIKKVYETKVEDLEKIKRLIFEGLNKIGSNPLCFETIMAQTVAQKENATKIMAKVDKVNHVNLSNTSFATVYYKNTPYCLSTYDRQSLSIIELKDMIKKAIPELDENKYELCRFTYKKIRENEHSLRHKYSSLIPKPLKTVVLSDSPNFIYLPKEFLQLNNENIPIFMHFNQSCEDN